MKKGLIVAIILALVVMLISGCAEISPPSEEEGVLTEEEGTGPLEEEGTGPLIVEEVNFRLWISDEVNAIDDFDELWVTINQIGVHKSGESGEWIEHELVPEERVDLTTLKGNNATELWNGDLDDGTYTKVFIYVRVVEGIIAGEEVNIRLPSGKLQISKPFDVVSGEVTDFVYDITVVKAGQSSKYNLLPQIAQSGPDQDIDDVTPEEDLEITTTSLLGGEEGAAYTDTVVATGGTGSYTWSVLTGSLPDELELDDDTGEISGTLATGTAGDYTFTVQVEDDSAQTDTQEFTILIEA